ncbi:hypothetical protein VUR80DRAFT_527 [Thermomyces stellatus]
MVADKYGSLKYISVHYHGPSPSRHISRLSPLLFSPEPQPIQETPLLPRQHPRPPEPGRPPFSPLAEARPRLASPAEPLQLREHRPRPPLLVQRRFQPGRVLSAEESQQRPRQRLPVVDGTGRRGPGRREGQRGRRAREVLVRECGEAARPVRR